MQVHALTPSAGKGSSPMRHHTPRLIELLGTPKFEEALFKAAREAAACEHVTAFAFAEMTQPRLLLAANTGDLPIAQMTAEKYLYRFWRLDPAKHAPSVGAGQEIAIRIRSDEIDDSGYRQECYTTVGLHDRISLIKPQYGEVFRINFYKSPRSGHFSPQEMEHIFEASDLIMALLAKHDAAAAPRQGKGAAKMFERRLKMISHSLPKREMEICTLIATGVSSEGIALELGISLNTVLTHRKRAYARLGISSQNELLRLLLS